MESHLTLIFYFIKYVIIIFFLYNYSSSLKLFNYGCFEIYRYINFKIFCAIPTFEKNPWIFTNFESLHKFPRIEIVQY